MGKSAQKKTVAVKATTGPAGRNSPSTSAKPTGKSAVKTSRPALPTPARPAAAKPAAPATLASKGKPTTASAKPAAAAKVNGTKPGAASPAKPSPAVSVSKPVTASKPASSAKPAAVAVAVKPVVSLKPAAMPAAGVAAAEARTDARASRAQKPVRVEPSRPPEFHRPIQTVETVNSSGDSKPKKNQAGLSVKELEYFRDLLLEKRRELVGDMSSMEREALQSGDHGLSSLPIHMADMGTDNYNQEFTLGLVEKERTMLREINHALAKIQNGSYGICEGNGQPIAKVRLEAQPWAKYSIEYARLQEKGPIRR